MPTNLDMLKKHVTAETVAEYMLSNPNLNCCAICSERDKVSHSKDIQCSWKCHERMVEWLNHEPSNVLELFF